MSTVKKTVKKKVKKEISIIKPVEFKEYELVFEDIVLTGKKVYDLNWLAMGRKFKKFLVYHPPKINIKKYLDIKKFYSVYELIWNYYINNQKCDLRNRIKEIFDYV